MELCNRVVKFYSFVGDLVFDPFAGSGTLGKSAFELKRFFFLTEKDPNYHERIKERFNPINMFDNKKKVPKFLTLNEFIKQKNL